jgi:hypothetical protein
MFARTAFAAVAALVITLSFSANAQESQVGTYSGNDVWQLSDIKNADPSLTPEAGKISEKNGQEYLHARKLRNALLPTPNCSYQSALTITCNVQKARELTYGKTNVNKEIKNMTLAAIADGYHKSQQAAGATALAAGTVDE